MAENAAGASPTPSLSSRRQILAGLVLAVSNFMVVLDLTIANVSVPHISGNLGITFDQGTWIITSYAVAEAICVPLTGWLAMRYGTVKVFISALIGFGMFSALCGMSQTLGMLVVCRIGQGLSGAPLMPASQALLLRVFPPERRATALGVWSMTMLLGPATGPIIGGFISDHFSWHWIFLINVPIAALCAGVGLVLLRGAETPIVRQPIDRFGLALLVFWIGCLQIMLDVGRDRDWFNDPLIVCLAIGAVVGCAVFVIWEMTEEHPAVDLRIFRHRGFTSSTIVFALVFAAYFASIVVIPQWLQGWMGYTATSAGLTTAFTAFAALFVAPFAPKIVQRIDPRPLICVAALNIGAMSLVRMGWTTSADFFSLSWPQVVQGLGFPFIMMPLTQLALTSVEPSEVASAAGLQNFMRTIAIAVATSIVLTIWGDQSRVATTQIAGALQPDGTMARLDRAGFGFEQSRAVVDSIAQQQASTVAMDYTFGVAAGVLALAALVVWIIPRQRLLGPIRSGH